MERLHQALMPDYNRKATVYWWTMVLLGALAVAYAGYQVHGLSWTVLPQILIGTAFAVAGRLLPGAHPGLEELVRGRRGRSSSCCC